MASAKAVKGWTLVVVSLLVILAAAVLVIGNLGMPATIHLYTTDLGASIGAVMALAGLSGVLVMWMFVALWRGVQAIRQARREAVAIAGKDQGNATTDANSPGTNT